MACANAADAATATGLLHHVTGPRRTVGAAVALSDSGHHNACVAGL